jgi:pilus assembly protein CpaF
MVEVFNINDLIYKLNAGQKSENNDNRKERTYKEVLDTIRHVISTNHSAELINIMYSEEAKEKLKNLIVRYLNQNKMSVFECDSISDLADRIYEDMAGFGILSKYITDPDVEEINVNAWNGIEVIYPDRVELIDKTFINPDDCMDKLKKMVWLGGSIVDGSTPIVDSFIGDGIRISSIIPPCVDKHTGGVASIRKQKKNVITREIMIEYGSAIEEELDFLSLCVNNGVSLAIAGSTGSGKTTDLSYLIGCLNSKKRIYTIEDTRELYIAKINEKGIMENRVVQTVTRNGVNPITMDDLLKKSLRFDPNVIIPAEMRGEEAITAIEAGRTGHTIISTLHANSAVDAYNRILSMCVSTGIRLSENKLLEFILEAVPLILFKRQLPDGRRVYDEIFEGLRVENGKVVGKTLYKYEIEDNVYDDNGNIIEVIGKHCRKNSMSDALLSRLKYGGASNEMLEAFM